MTKKMGIQFFALPGEVFQFLEDVRKEQFSNCMSMTILDRSGGKYNCRKYETADAEKILAKGNGVEIAVQWQEPLFSDTRVSYQRLNPNTFYIDIPKQKDNTLLESFGSMVWDSDADVSNAKKFMKRLKKNLIHKKLKLISNISGKTIECFYTHWWYSKGAYEFQQSGGKIQPLQCQTHMKVILEAPIDQKRGDANEKIALGEGDKTP
jgi:hypothetical protein